MKKLIIFLLSYILLACSANPSDNKFNADTNAMKQREGKVGGWAPVFFTAMDEDKLDSIAAGLKDKSIQRVVITYPTKMQDLAIQIHDYLENKTHQNIPLKTIELKDTTQVKYNLTQVIVTLYFKD